jgi:hypothetical protein
MEPQKIYFEKAFLYKNTPTDKQIFTVNQLGVYLKNFSIKSNVYYFLLLISTIKSYNSSRVVAFSTALLYCSPSDRLATSSFMFNSA